MDSGDQGVGANNSHTQTPPEERVAMKIVEEKSALTAVISFMAVIIALGCIGNILAITAVAHTKKLQTVSNMFVANLSSCDLVIVTVVLPVNMYTYLGDGWTFPDVICKCMGFLSYTLTGTTIMTITLIAWNRYKLVAATKESARLFRPRNVGLMVVATWVLPVVCLLPAAFGIWGHFGYTPMLSSCNLDLDSSSQSFKIFLLIIRAVIPCGMIVYFYSAIYATTRESHKRLHYISSSSSNIMRQNNHKKEMRLTRMMIAIFVVYVFSYFPCTISSLIDWSRMLSKTFHMFCQTSVFLGSAINPILYGFMNEQFREAYYKILTCSILLGKCSSKSHEKSHKRTDKDKTEDKTLALLIKNYEILLQIEMQYI